MSDDSGDDIAWETRLAESVPTLPGKPASVEKKRRARKTKREAVMSSKSCTQRVKDALENDLWGVGERSLEKYSPDEVQALYDALELKPDQKEAVSAIMRYKSAKRLKPLTEEKNELDILSKVAGMSLNKLKRTLEPFGIQGSRKDVILRRLTKTLADDTKKSAKERVLKKEALQSICRAAGISGVASDDWQTLVQKICSVDQKSPQKK